jgi:ligand-binding sensor protein
VLGPNLGLADLVSSAGLQNIQDSYAQAAGVASLMVDLRGQALTTISNSCGLCELARTSAEFRYRCSQSWAECADVTEERPGVRLCHAGLGYAVAPVQVLGKRIGFVVGGQFWAESPAPAQAQAVASRLADQYGFPPAETLQAIERVPVLTRERVFLVTHLLATVANTMSEIGLQAYVIRTRLEQIAQLARVL